MSVSNKQIAEVLNYLSDEINRNVKTYKELQPKYQLLEEKYRRNLMELNSKINGLHAIVLRPDLNDLDAFYVQKTEGSINELQNRLKVPNMMLYSWLGCLSLFIVSCLMVYLSYSSLFKSKREIIDQHEKELFSKNVLFSKENYHLANDAFRWFRENPKTYERFKKWRDTENSKK